MESAKRASEIHKKRTGRYYRITEETVINEQMYEEEDDTPRYRLAANLHLPNTLLQQRAQALMSIQMENRRLLGQAVNSTLQHNAQFGNQSQFVSPGMMSMPQFGNQYPMSSPQIFNQSPQTPTFHHSPQTPMNYPHSPYPASPDGMKQNFHQRSASIAEPPQYRPSAHNSPVESQSRRTSMPPQIMPALSNESDKADSAVSSSTATPDTPAPYQQPNHPSYDPSYQNIGNMLGPLTTELAMETRQLLGSGIWPNIDESTYDRMMQHPNDPAYQQPFLYNYRPNASKAGKDVPTSAGLDQTLTSTPPPSSLNSTSNAPEPIYGYGYNDNINHPTFFNYDSVDGYHAFSSGANSVHTTPPATEEWASFLDNDMFGEAQYGAGV